MTPGQADQFVAPLKATEPSQLIVRDPKILLEDVSVLASIVSSRGSQHPGACRLDSWFLDAMWEGLSQLCYTNQVDDVKHEEPEGAMRVLVDDVMSRFGKRAKKFRSKIRRDATKRPELDGSKFMPHQGTDQPDEETEANLKAADVLAKKNENLEQEKRRLEERYEELLLAERKLK
ncbi:hypothetical protein FRC10_000364 [Ceratobasidium sp. 414]|nr:hypothetical protein FRC10_000364 [Ceratobasidium sp. 414]